VSFEDAKAYADWLSAQTGEPYRLLSEAEWEYAARAGSTSPFAWGATLATDQANYDGTASYGGGPKGATRGSTVAAGSFKANAFGLNELAGNAWEWVADCWHATLADTPTDGTASASGDCSKRVRRGGSWYSLPSDLRSACRIGYDATDRASSTGFRVARALVPAGSGAPKVSDSSAPKP
jgi:formylglycine-generating enzyme required for sulfatase activity